MKNFLSVMILLTTLIVVGCTSESFSVSVTNGDIHVKGKTCNESSGTAQLDGDGACVLVGESKIDSGKIDMNVGGKIYTFDKTQEISVDVPAGTSEINFNAHDNFTGEINLKAVPKI